MTPRDQIHKASWTIVESVKRTVSLNIQELVRTGSLKIDKKAMPGLIFMLHNAIEAGYQDGLEDFMRKVNVALDQNHVEKKRSKIKALFGIREK